MVIKQSVFKFDLVNESRRESFEHCFEWINKSIQQVEWLSNSTPVCAILRINACGYTVHVDSEWINDPDGEQLAGLIHQCFGFLSTADFHPDINSSFRLFIIPGATRVLYHLEENPEKLPAVFQLFPEYLATDRQNVFFGVPSDEPFDRYNSAWLTRFHLLCRKEQVNYSLNFCDGSNEWYFDCDDCGPTKDHTALPFSCSYYVESVIDSCIDQLKNNKEKK